MKRIDAWRTNGGEVFTDRREALKSIENQLGEILTKHGAALAHMTKYTAFVEYLEANLDSLALARALQLELATSEV